MRQTLILLFFVIVLLSNVFADSGIEYAARDAVSGDQARASAAIEVLRGQKQAGLDLLFITYAAEIAQKRSSLKDVRNWPAIAQALDAVAMQKDAYSSRLFWHTDLDEAIKEATIENKPILSLRLLGNLNEEYSCANSRLFRSILYTDPAVAKTLREDYVLHWQSERPAPKITIDFGDGRKLVRTVTGNSIHYILSSTGMIVDALPGLYDPETFLSYLTELKVFASNKAVLFGGANEYRLRKGIALTEDWDRRLNLIDKNPSFKDDNRSSGSPVQGKLNAMRAMRLTATKSAIESPAVLALMPQIEKLRENTGRDDWEQLANIGKPVRLSRESLSFIRSKSGDIGDTEFSQLIGNLKNYVAIDTVQNEFRFHLTLMGWLDTFSSADYEGFNQRVYSDLFLTPDSDKWLGLYEPDTYSAIENNGVIR